MMCEPRPMMHLRPMVTTGEMQHLLFAADARGQTDVGPNERLVTDREVTLVVDDALRGHQGRRLAEVVELLGVRIVGPTVATSLT